MARLKLFNPVARSLENRVDPPPRIRDLNGKRIGLYWNLKSGGDAALQATEELLRERYPEAQFTYHHGSAGAGFRHATAAELDRVARECDAVIGTTSD